MLMMIIKSLVFITLGVCVLFFLLGLLSQKGKSKRLENGRLADCPASPNAVSSEPGTQPEKYVEPLQAKLEDVLQAIKDIGGVITSQSDNYLSATYMSAVFKFVDDVEVRADGALCHIRSASRVGYSDRGANRKRVAAIRAAL
jgi:uncharacterized protein (DUF1499 family)